MAALRLALTLARLLAAQALRRLGVTLGLWVLALVFGLVGVMGLALACFIALAQVWSPLAAALIIGLGGVLLSVVLWLIARSRRHFPDLSGVETSDLREALGGHKTEAGVWLPLVGLALLGFLLGSGKKE